MNSHPLDAARIGVLHLEFEARGMADEFATQRYTSEQGENETRQRVHIVFILFLDETDADPGEKTAEEVIEYGKENLTGYKRPRHVEFIDELPKSNVGKILRKDLRALEEKNHG